jgi:hypothetical protein
MEQVPAARIVTVFPETVQTTGVVEAKLTVRPELAVALMVNGAIPTFTLFTGPNGVIIAPGAVSVNVIV